MGGRTDDETAFGTKGLDFPEPLDFGADRHGQSEGRRLQCVVHSGTPTASHDGRGTEAIHVLQEADFVEKEAIRTHPVFRLASGHPWKSGFFGPGFNMAPLHFMWRDKEAPSRSRQDGEEVPDRLPVALPGAAHHEQFAAVHPVGNLVDAVLGGPTRGRLNGGKHAVDAGVSEDIGSKADRAEGLGGSRVLDQEVGEPRQTLSDPPAPAAHRMASRIESGGYEVQASAPGEADFDEPRPQFIFHENGVRHRQGYVESLHVPKRIEGQVIHVVRRFGRHRLFPARGEKGEEEGAFRSPVSERLEQGSGLFVFPEGSAVHVNPRPWLFVGHRVGGHCEPIRPSPAPGDRLPGLLVPEEGGEVKADPEDRGPEGIEKAEHQ